MLTDMKVRKAKCAEGKRQTKITDGSGLYVLVNDRGGKYWRMDYRYGGKRKTLSFGVYPKIGLSEARKLRDDAKEALDSGLDPAFIKTTTAAATFRAIYEEWTDHRRSTLTPKTAKSIESRMAMHVLPAIGDAPIEKITAPIVLAIIRKIEKRGTIHTAHKVNGIIGQIMRYAIATGRATNDPTQSLRGALLPDVVTSRAALLAPNDIGGLMRAISCYGGAASVRIALDVLARVFTRPGELRKAQWDEIDTARGCWQVPAERMKMKGRGAHIVPLSHQVIALLDEAADIYGHEGNIFPGTRPKSMMSDNTLNMALRAMGYDGNTHVAHGFRAMARSTLAEHGWPIPAIERQLAHAEKDRIAQAYARSEFLEVRASMMQAWSDYLDLLKGGNIEAARDRLRT